MGKKNKKTKEKAAAAAPEAASLTKGEKKEILDIVNQILEGN